MSINTVKNTVLQITPAELPVSGGNCPTVDFAWLFFKGVKGLFIVKKVLLQKNQFSVFVLGNIFSSFNCQKNCQSKNLKWKFIFLSLNWIWWLKNTRSVILVCLCLLELRANRFWEKKYHYGKLLPCSAMVTLRNTGRLFIDKQSFPRLRRC